MVILNNNSAMGGHQCVISLQNHNDSDDYHIACFQVCSKNKWLIYPQHCINSIISLLVITEMFPCFRIIFQLQSLGSMILNSADENILILVLYLLLFLPLKPGCISTPCVITHPGSNNVVDPEPIHVWRITLLDKCHLLWNRWVKHLTVASSAKNKTSFALSFLPVLAVMAAPSKVKCLNDNSLYRLHKTASQYHMIFCNVCLF